MIIQVNGQNVNVDDSYAKLSPEEQQATQQEIAQSIGMHQEAAQKQQQTQQQQANPQGMAAGGSDIRQAIDPAIAVGAVGIPAAAKGYEMYKGAQLASGAIDWMRGSAGAVNPATVARNTTKVADMASSNAVRDIALQGLQKGVQGVAAAAGAIAPYIRGFTGAALMAHSEGLNRGEDEMVRQMHAAQDRQTGQQSPIPQGPVNPQGQY